LLVIHHNSVCKFEVLAAVKLAQHVAHQVEYNDTHHFALDNDNVAFVVDGHTTRMLQDVGAEFAHKLAILIVNLNLMGGRALGENDIARLLHYCHTIWVEELPVALAIFANLEFEAAIFVENLNSVTVGVGDDDVVLSIDSHSRWLSELALHDAELAELAVVDHLLSLNLRRDW
jgi:hypothetical protein